MIIVFDYSWMNLKLFWNDILDLNVRIFVQKCIRTWMLSCKIRSRSEIHAPMNKLTGDYRYHGVKKIAVIDTWNSILNSQCKRPSYYHTGCVIFFLLQKPINNHFFHIKLNQQKKNPMNRKRFLQKLFNQIQSII